MLKKDNSIKSTSFFMTCEECVVKTQIILETIKRWNNDDHNSYMDIYIYSLNFSAS